MLMTVRTWCGRCRCSLTWYHRSGESTRISCCVCRTWKGN